MIAVRRLHELDFDHLTTLRASVELPRGRSAQIEKDSQHHDDQDQIGEQAAAN